MKTLRYLIEAGVLYVVFFIFKLMPAGVASNLGGWIGRTVGPRLGASKKARRNIEKALPDANADTIITEMWGSLGRLIAEYPHLETIARNHTTLVGGEHAQRVTESGKKIIFIGGHFANFEIPTIAAYIHAGILSEITYRAPNNPWSDQLLMKCRTMNGKFPAHAKSSSGGRSLMKALKKGANAGILIDQKYNEGINVPFFGMPAMTNPAFVQLAQKYDLAVLPIRIVRVDGIKMELHICEPLDLNGTPEDVIARAHIVLESWIKDTPGQWLWLHRRWKDF